MRDEQRSHQNHNGTDRGNRSEVASTTNRDTTIGMEDIDDDGRGSVKSLKESPIKQKEPTMSKFSAMDFMPQNLEDYTAPKLVNESLSKTVNSSAATKPSGSK